MKFNVRKNLRRNSALSRLQTQLDYGFKTIKNGEEFDLSLPDGKGIMQNTKWLTEHDKIRIEEEIKVLEGRIKR